MRVLLDTHIMIWMFQDDPRLSDRARELVLDRGNSLFCSAVSVWEVALKHRRRPRGNIGADEFLSYCDEAGILQLPLKQEHLTGLASLPEVHADPFDQALLCQVSAEGMRLLTHDGLLARYPDEVVIAV